MKIFAKAKVNIFLKIVGKRGEYHELLSRFVRVEDLYDELSIEKKQTADYFELVGEFGCPLEKNTLYKALVAFKEAGFTKEVDEFCATYALHVKKNIPSFAGLGGGSSDAASFLVMLNELLNTHLSKEQLSQIGSKVGADVPFFIYDYASANVSGIGEVVEVFDEEVLHVKVFTPTLACDTAKVYKAFRQNYKIDLPLADTMSKMKSSELLQKYQDIELNDLLPAALSLYPALEEYRKKGWFFSGSGSSFFHIKS
ncbi:MAG TPA: 4-(cytidine 5'-diphospho)-2-C-methyl-D-erythritol kinase [Sulfurospirillum sp. UBA12182]|nr:MAG TPA: 4-(cytidine 5'-diphospho)-2-C-methyl-D-erythritol kinase [Sulfurospirillum sp. UBA12182]